MTVRKINIFANDAYSQEIRSCSRSCSRAGLRYPRSLLRRGLIISIGGDGAFLRTLHKYEFPSIPFLGVNTGHLGFFQEIHPDELDEFIFLYSRGDTTSRI